MARVPVVLVVHLIVLAVGTLILVFSGESSLDTLVHRCTLQSLLWHLALVVHILRLSIPRVGHVAA